MDNIAIITGILGQDGSYLADYLLNKKYKVIGVHRRTSSLKINNIKNILNDIILIEGDVCDYGSMYRIIKKYKPTELYHLAAQSHVYTSFEQPNYTSNVIYLGTLNILECLREFNDIKLYNASSSEMFGDSFTQKINSNNLGPKYQDELTSFNPQSPYAIAKLAAHKAVGLYRKAYGLHASCGILFNHESPRRGENFVTRKIIKWLHKFKQWDKDNIDNENGGFNYDYNIIKDMISVVRHNKNHKPYGHKESWLFGQKFNKLKLGNITAQRDWGYAPEFVEGMWLMLQQEQPDDYVLATGETHTIEDFLQEAFNLKSLNWKDFVEIDESLMRPAEVPYLCGNYSKAKRVLGWEPKTKFKQLVKLMVDGEND